MQYRHEWKIEINTMDCLLLTQRLSAVMRPDPHAGETGAYAIRSLYFDNACDSALREKIDGVNNREKFRLRCYNGDNSLIRLEKKCKENGLGYKLSAPLSVEETRAILDGDILWMEQSEHQVVRELFERMLHGGFRPKTIVDYTRQPFLYDAGNVRVTLDYDIRTGLRNTDFLDPNSLTIPAGDVTLLEVKYDAFLPDIIRQAIQLHSRRTQAFSKYAACRIYG